MKVYSNAKTFYRIEHADTARSLWYKPDGTYAPFINKLTEGKAAALPMGFDAAYYELHTTWYSALKSKENAYYWFSDRDAYELMKSGYKLYEITAKDIRIKEHEIMYSQEGILLKTEIPIETIWKINKYNKGGY